MQDIEPFYGWLTHYNSSEDEHSPFYTVEHSEFYYDRAVYNYLAHPLWDQIESESLLVKILYADYDKGYAIIELMGVWNDLLENDFRLLTENCLQWLIDAGCDKFIFICEKLFNIYVQDDDYYTSMEEELDGGWMCLIRPKEHIKEDLVEYDLDGYFFWSPTLDDLKWRKLKPWELFALVNNQMGRVLGGN